MRVNVEYFAQLRTSGGIESEHYDLPENSDVNALLLVIKARHKGPLAEILGGEGELPGWITVVVDDHAVVADQTLPEDSTVRFLAPISGG